MTVKLLPHPFDPDVNFHYGIPDTKMRHWALYEPASQRFLFASDFQEIDVLQEIRMLCSSRYNLFLCDISSAENYHDGILDNTCCENWSMIGDFIDTQLFASPIFDIDKLVPSGGTEIDDSVIQEQKNWIQFIQHWVNWLRLGPLAEPRLQIDSFIEQILYLKFDNTSTHDFFSNLQKLVRDIKLELYLGNDIDSSQNKIIKLLETNIWYQSIKF